MNASRDFPPFTDTDEELPCIFPVVAGFWYGCVPSWVPRLYSTPFWSKADWNTNDLLVAVGVEVGAKIGAEVGVEVGAKIGTEVGVEVGAELGAKVGAEVGAEVGADEGREIVPKTCNSATCNEFQPVVPVILTDVFCFARSHTNCPAPIHVAVEVDPS